MSVNTQLLDGDALKRVLETELPRCSEFILISAYLTLPAIDWLTKCLPNGAAVSIVSRLSPHDFLAGSSSIDAVKMALSAKYKVSIIENLHAKIYSIDKRRIFVGSANFTTNGLKLFGEGNLEAVLEAGASNENLLFIDQILRSAIEIDVNVLSKMASFLEGVPSSKRLAGLTLTSSWPEKVLPRNSDLWVHDFPWINLNDPQPTVEAALHDELLFSTNHEGSETFNDSKVLRWLVKILEERVNQEMYFGEISASLHNYLKDDPRPYRREVKQLLANLLTYCQKYSSKQICIDTPSHSQRVRLVTS